SPALKRLPSELSALPTAGAGSCPTGTTVKPGTFGMSATSAGVAIASSSVSARLRSEEHTSELQSRFDLVCRLLLEKKKKIRSFTTTLSKFKSEFMRNIIIDAHHFTIPNISHTTTGHILLFY